ncbi:restriction endonuclease subunit S [Providencia stuartii]|uniref:restriction endonuclease subunit S n=1 Tax=Providencia stuartii TaxID=588 RepID=UPI001B58994C|nr:restriction endonuclease subunit S [Providencia stuartii]MBQ0458589.1 restriction endonuclease subunit S [Providencia stuartii]
MSEWQSYKIDEIAILTQGLAINAKTKHLLVEYSEYPLLRIKDLLENTKEQFVDPKLVPEQCIVKPHDLIMSRTGQVGFVFINREGVLHNNLFKINIKDNKILDVKFLYWHFNRKERREYLTNIATGSVQPDLSHKVFKDYEILLPPLPEQKAIADVLSSLDDKIDLLHRQNKTLESMAETLFRQWFVEEAQDDWEEVKVSHFVTLNKSSITKKYDHQNILYLDTSSLTKGYISELKLLILSEAPSRAKRLVQHLDILISTVRPDQCHYGFCFKPEANLVVSTGFCTITCDTITPYFIYYLLTSEDMTEYLHSIAEGSTSTYPSLKPEDIGNVLFALPPKEKLNDYHNVVGAMWNKINQTQKQIQTLENLRDTLLPKLMSGEVRVKYTPEEIKQ